MDKLRGNTSAKHLYFWTRIGIEHQCSLGQMFADNRFMTLKVIYCLVILSEQMALAVLITLRWSTGSRSIVLVYLYAVFG